MKREEMGKMISLIDDDKLAEAIYEMQDGREPGMP